jgi:hypothetical protein
VWYEEEKRKAPKIFGCKNWNEEISWKTGGVIPWSRVLLEKEIVRSTSQ